MWIVGRADYSNPRFVIEVRWHYGFLSRLLARRLNRNLRLSIRFEQDNRLCLDCFACVMYDVRTLFGAKRLLVNVEEGTIELKVRDHQRLSPLLGDDFEKVTDIVGRQLACCKAGDHRNLDSTA